MKPARARPRGHQVPREGPRRSRQTRARRPPQLLWIAEGGSRAGLPGGGASPAGRREHFRGGWARSGRRGRDRPRRSRGSCRAPAPPPARALHLRDPRPRGRRPPAVSPDGRILAFDADAPRASAYDLGSSARAPGPRPRGGHRGRPAVWSPGQKFCRVHRGREATQDRPLSGGPPQALCDAPRAAGHLERGGGWILFDGPGPRSRSGEWKRQAVSRSLPPGPPHEGTDFCRLAPVPARRPTLPLRRDKQNVTTCTSWSGELGSTDRKELFKTTSPSCLRASRISRLRPRTNPGGPAFRREETGDHGRAHSTRRGPRGQQHRRGLVLALLPPGFSSSGPGRPPGATCRLDGSEWQGNACPRRPEGLHRHVAVTRRKPALPLPSTRAAPRARHLDP